MFGPHLRTVAGAARDRPLPRPDRVDFALALAHREEVAFTTFGGARGTAAEAFAPSRGTTIAFTPSGGVEVGGAALAPAEAEEEAFVPSGGATAAVACAPSGGVEVGVGAPVPEEKEKEAFVPSGVAFTPSGGAGAVAFTRSGGATAAVAFTPSEGVEVGGLRSRRKKKKKGSRALAVRRPRSRREWKRSQSRETLQWSGLRSHSRSSHSRSAEARLPPAVKRQCPRFRGRSHSPVADPPSRTERHRTRSEWHQGRGEGIAAKSRRQFHQKHRQRWKWH
jgi:hypothetical protein